MRDLPCLKECHELLISPGYSYGGWEVYDATMTRSCCLTRSEISFLLWASVHLPTWCAWLDETLVDSTVSYHFEEYTTGPLLSWTSITASISKLCTLFSRQRRRMWKRDTRPCCVLILSVVVTQRQVDRTVQSVLRLLVSWTTSAIPDDRHSVPSDLSDSFVLLNDAAARLWLLGGHPDRFARTKSPRLLAWPVELSGG